MRESKAHRVTCTEMHFEIHEEIDKSVVKKLELNDALQEQNSINEALCAENCSARWLWKSGEL